MAIDVETPTYAEATRELLRERVLDATRSELEQRVWPQVTMGAIAARAGVSRQTLYNEFGTRDELAQAFVLREEERLVAAVAATIQAHADDPTQALTSAFGLFLAATREDPLIRRMLSEEGADGMLPLLTTRGRPVVRGAVARLTAMIVSCWPGVDRSDAELLSECLVRLGISYAALPAGSATMTAASVATLLGPFIEAALANAVA